MRCTIVVAALMLCGCFVTGCVVVRPPDPVVYDPEEAGTMKEIEAAMAQDFENSRVSALDRIARRQGLSPHAQAKLARSALALDFETSRSQILLTLINNADFAPHAKNIILDNLDRLDFEVTRQQILQALDARGPLRPCAVPA
jgi:hypothetical protein